MEKIVIFIIIMIISSFFSKKKKKKPYTPKQTNTTYFDNKGNVVSKSNSTHSTTTSNRVESVQSFSEAVSELKNIFGNVQEHKQTVKSEPASEPVYEKNIPEVSNEKNNSSYSERNYREVQKSHDDINIATTGRYGRKERIVESVHTIKPVVSAQKKSAYDIKTKHKKLNLSNLLSSKMQLKRAVIMTEIFNKKY